MKTKKQTIRLTEADLHRVIKESVNRILSENGCEWYHEGNPKDSEKMERAHQRLHKKYHGKLSPQEIERMAEREVYGRAVKESVNRVLKEDYNGEIEVWNKAKEILEPRLIVQALEHLLDSDGLLEEYANRLAEMYDL